MSEAYIPSPGSSLAGEQGCNCAVIDNGYGLGYMSQAGIYCVRVDCPLHGRGSESEKGRDEEVPRG